MTKGAVSFFEKIILAAGNQRFIDYPYCICDRLNKIIKKDSGFISVKTELESNSINVHAIDKKVLVKIWGSESSSVTKILVTLLWGGIRTSNLNHVLATNDLEELCNGIIKSMNDILKASTTEDFFIRLKESFRKLAVMHQDGNCHIKGVSEAFFTKFYHFFFEANKEKNKVGIHPIIGDQWMRLAVCADMISNNRSFNDIFERKDGRVSFYNHGKKSEADSYVKMVKYYNERVNELKQRYPFLSAFSLESLLFGQHTVNGFCPRCEAQSIVNTNRIINELCY